MRPDLSPDLLAEYDRPEPPPFQRQIPIRLSRPHHERLRRLSARCNLLPTVLARRALMAYVSGALEPVAPPRGADDSLDCCMTVKLTDEQETVVSRYLRLADLKPGVVARLAVLALLDTEPEPYRGDAPATP